MAERPRRPPGKEEAKRLNWREIRISYRTLQVGGLVLLLLVGAAVGSVLYARARGTESAVGRFLSVARHKVNQRVKLLSTSGSREQDEVLEQRFATLSFFSGTVKIQRVTDLNWDDPKEQMKLAAGDRVRTFSNSRAEVSFDDGNVLRIKPDSLIVIGDLTENVRTKVKKSSVRLLVSNVEADIKKSVVKGSQFRLEMPSAVAEVEKARVAVAIGKDNQSQVSVFSGQVDIDTGAQKVQVSDRKSVTISAGRQVSAPEAILPAARLRAPAPLAEFPTNSGSSPVACRWDAVPGARTYRVELASDRFFDKVVHAAAEVPALEHRTPAVPEGIYYLRVAGLDVQGRQGDFSPTVPVRVLKDQVPPFIEVQKLVVMRTARGRELLINGRTEPHVSVWVGPQEVAVDENGYFSAVLRGAVAGQSEVEVTARDRAGNVRTLRQAVQA